mmetsp:Transcript_17366/g.26541  ORF Transcript_17366/g.26541 Transcript_17366/m.26541 type:complete len:208 (+) Transcript_17366:104-727(+)
MKPSLHKNNNNPKLQTYLTVVTTTETLMPQWALSQQQDTITENYLSDQKGDYNIESIEQGLKQTTFLVAKTCGLAKSGNAVKKSLCKNPLMGSTGGLFEPASSALQDSTPYSIPVARSAPELVASSVSFAPIKTSDTATGGMSWHTNTWVCNSGNTVKLLHKNPFMGSAGGLFHPTSSVLQDIFVAWFQYLECDNNKEAKKMKFVLN